MQEELSLNQMKKEWHGTLQSYVIGLIGSFVLTSISFLLVIGKFFSGNTLVFTIVGLALVQAAWQLIFFLHLGQEAKPKWETLIFCFMFLVLLIIAVGSLWVMYDLENRVMMEMPHD